jgi:hypothetical protein
MTPEVVARGDIGGLVRHQRGATNAVPAELRTAS